MKALKITVSALALLAGAAGQPALANSMFDQGLQDRTGWEQWVQQPAGRLQDRGLLLGRPALATASR
jgi:hypothetical protein